MRKLNLLSVIRRRRPYARYRQAIHKYPNLLNRSFDQATPNQFWVTDITYIPIPGKMLYMCAVLDLCGKVVLAWKMVRICVLLSLQIPFAKLCNEKRSLMDLSSTVTKGLNTHRKHTST